MTSVANNERNGQRRRDVLLERSHMGIDDELLRDVLTKVRARRARRTHPSPTSRPNGLYLGRLGHDDAEKEQAPLDEGKTKILSVDPCCTDFRCFEVLGMEPRSQNKLLVRDGRSAIEHNALGRTAAFSKQRESESIGSKSSLNSSSRLRNDQASASPRMRANRNAYVTSRAEVSSPSREDISIAWWRPDDSHSIGSQSDRSFNPSLASRSPTSSTAGNKGVSKTSGFQSTLNTQTRREGHARAEYATKQGGSNAIGSNFSLHSSSTARSKQVSKPHVDQSTSPSKKSYEPAGRGMQVGGSKAFESAVPLRSKGTTSNRQVSKPCAVCVAKQGGSSVLGSNISRHSQNSATNKGFAFQPLFQRKTSQQRHACARCEDVPGDSSDRGSNSSLQSRSTALSRQSYKSPEMQSKSHTIPKEGVTRTMPGMSPSIRSSSNALPNSSRASFAAGGSKAIVSNSSVLSKSTASSRQTYESRGLQSKSHVIRPESVSRKSPEKYVPIRESSTLSNQSSASLSSTENSSKGRDSNRRGVSGNGEAGKTSSPRDLAIFLRENGRTRTLDSTADSVSALSLPSTSTAQTRNSIHASERLNPVYPGDRYGSKETDGDYLSGDDSSDCSHPKSSELGSVVDSIRSTARDILSSDVEDVWLSRAVLNGIAESKKVSVDSLIESVCDQLDELDDSLCIGGKNEPPKRLLPKLHFSVKW